MSIPEVIWKLLVIPEVFYFVFWWMLEPCKNHQSWPCLFCSVKLESWYSSHVMIKCLGWLRKYFHSNIFSSVNWSLCKRHPPIHFGQELWAWFSFCGLTWVQDKPEESWVLQTAHQDLQIVNFSWMIWMFFIGQYRRHLRTNHVVREGEWIAMKEELL